MFYCYKFTRRQYNEYQWRLSHSGWFRFSAQMSKKCLHSLMYETDSGHDIKLKLTWVDNPQRISIRRSHELLYTTKHGDISPNTEMKTV